MLRSLVVVAWHPVLEASVLRKGAGMVFSVSLSLTHSLTQSQRSLLSPIQPRTHRIILHVSVNNLSRFFFYLPIASSTVPFVVYLYQQTISKRAFFPLSHFSRYFPFADPDLSLPWVLSFGWGGVYLFEVSEVGYKSTTSPGVQ
jgi:hypothetical protein